jgi:hypothetical protein
VDIRRIRCDGIDWIDLAQNREHGNEFSNSIKVGKSLNSCTTGGLSRRAQLHGVR